MNGIRSQIGGDKEASIIQLQSQLVSIKTFFYMLDIFVVVIAVITMVLSFFLLMVSCKTNIAENSWELGVLRALGLDKE